MKYFTKLNAALMAVMAVFALSSSAQTNHTVTVSNFEFTPASITIAPGDIVTFVNVEGFHNAAGSTDVFPDNPESFTTGDAAPAPWTETVTLTLEGTYTYQCDIHPFMVGTITVESSTPPCEDPYPAVTGLADSPQGSGILISWDPIDGSIGCQIRVGPQGQSQQTKTIGGSNVSQFFIPGQFLNPGTTYDWGVRCGCQQNPIIAGPWSDSSFIVPGGAAISSSPNPTTDVSNVTFTMVEEGNATLEVYDLSGRSVETIFSGSATPDSEYRFSFSGAVLTPGVYLYRLTTDSEVVIEKFMISR